MLHSTAPCRCESGARAIPCPTEIERSCLHQIWSGTFLKDLPTFLATQHTSLVAAPYSLFAAEVVKKFTRHVFGPKPSQSVSPQELRAIGCGCAVCDKHLVPFLTSNSVTQVSGRSRRIVYI
ncbi:hypothetical protein CPB85DRAFT_587367 [Mucidula mucida]|nr:hypothetical protein CPB85DRAFT_587367 [Mucidula mucida]